MIVKIKLVFQILVFIFLISCETNPPNQPENENKILMVVVSSNIEGASIFVDDEFTGKVTPDTLLLAPGYYEISLEREGFLSNSRDIIIGDQILQNIYIELVASNFNKVILIEDFANVSCDPCVISNRILRDVEKEMGDKIAVIKYSTNFPSPSDPFYLGAKAFNDARMSYYNILFAPTIIIDGIERPIPTDSSAVNTAVSQRFSDEVLFSIEVKDSISNSTMFIDVDATATNSSINISDYRLYAVILEETINYNDPPGSNGETEFYNVMRSILPDNSGAVLSNSNGSNNFNFSSQILNSWNINELSAVVFIQNIETGEIMNAISARD